MQLKPCTNRMIEKARRAGASNLTDQQLDMLGQRFDANRIAQYCGVTFEQYLQRPEHFDALARHMEAGGGCRVVRDELVAISNGLAGHCEDCGRWNSERAGGLNEHGQCQECEGKFPVQAVAA